MNVHMMTSQVLVCFLVLVNKYILLYTAFALMFQSFYFIF